MYKKNLDKFGIEFTEMFRMKINVSAIFGLHGENLFNFLPLIISFHKNWVLKSKHKNYFKKLQFLNIYTAINFFKIKITEFFV